MMPSIPSSSSGCLLWNHSQLFLNDLIIFTRGTFNNDLRLEFLLKRSLVLPLTLPYNNLFSASVDFIWSKLTFPLPWTIILRKKPFAVQFFVLYKHFFTISEFPSWRLLCLVSLQFRGHFSPRILTCGINEILEFTTPFTHCLSRIALRCWSSLIYLLA